MQPQEKFKHLESVARSLRKGGALAEVIGDTLATLNDASEPRLLESDVRGLVTWAQSAPVGRGTTTTVAEVMARDIPPARWAVRDLVPEGVSLLVGAPKVGKSWLGLQFGMCIADGSPLWHGREPEAAGDVLMLALEDNDRRIQARAGKLLDARTDVDEHGHPARKPDCARLHYATTWPRMDAGGIEQLSEWLTEHPDARLVVIDTLGRFRPPESARASAYAQDYKIGELLKPLADRHGVAILLLHHSRKAAAADVLDTVSGTAGLSGSVDALLILRRERGAMDAGLYVTGRDIEHEVDHALKFDAPTCTWSSVGTVADAQLSSERREVLDYLGECGAARPREIAAAIGKNGGAIRYLLHRMVHDGEVRAEGGKYLPTLTPPNSPNNANGPNAANGLTREREGVRGVRGVSGVSGDSRDAAAYREARGG